MAVYRSTYTLTPYDEPEEGVLAFSKSWEKRIQIKTLYLRLSAQIKWLSAWLMDGKACKEIIGMRMREQFGPIAEVC
ncbi:MAG: hypothetical protein AB7O96_20390 [Pseudobdellovibrionaceae bacterium]